MTHFCETAIYSQIDSKAKNFFHYMGTQLTRMITSWKLDVFSFAKEIEVISFSYMNINKIY